MGWILSFTFLLGCAASKSALAQQSNSTSEVLLSGNRTDPCFDFATVTERIDCLQSLLESYYGERSTKYCPSLSETLISWRCNGCPRDRLDPERVTSRTARSVNRSFLFHPSQPTCSIADVAFRFATPAVPRRYTLHFGNFGVILPTLSNMAALYVDDRGNPKQPEIFGWILPETFFVFLIKLNFYFGIALNSSIRFYMYLCGSRTAWNAAYFIYVEKRRSQQYTRQTMRLLDSFSYGDTLIQEPKPGKHFKGHGDRSCPAGLSYPFKTRIFSLFVCIGGLISVFGSALVGLASVQDHVPYAAGSIGICGNGTKNFSFGIVVYATLFVQIATTTIYSFGPRKNKKIFLLRYVCLALATVLYGLRYTILFLRDSVCANAH